MCRHFSGHLAQCHLVLLWRHASLLLQNKTLKLHLQQLNIDLLELQRQVLQIAGLTIIFPSFRAQAIVDWFIAENRLSTASANCKIGLVLITILCSEAKQRTDILDYARLRN